MRREFSQIGIGDEIEEQSHRPTQVQLFRYSAVTWNSHRIHYDRPYAEKEGYPDVLVQSHLHGAFLTKLCTDWMGEDGRLVRLALRVRRFAVPGDVLVCRGTVVDKAVVDGEGRVTLRLEEVRSDGEVCAPGEAVVAFPLAET
ncbi:MAG: acyl dehydratase [Streptosporangiales bacterium]|nr:acyl dehydratase [Streptosporangiales bacterium]